MCLANKQKDRKSSLENILTYIAVTISHKFLVSSILNGLITSNLTGMFAYIISENTRDFGRL